MLQIAKHLRLLKNKEIVMKFTGFEKLVAWTIVGAAVLTIVLTLSPYEYLHAV